MNQEVAMKQYNYYRAGILIARFQISADTVLCSPRDLKTMEFAPYAPFALPIWTSASPMR